MLRSLSNKRKNGTITTKHPYVIRNQKGYLALIRYVNEYTDGRQQAGTTSLEVGVMTKKGITYMPMEEFDPTDTKLRIYTTKILQDMAKIVIRSKTKQKTYRLDLKGLL